jgi:O-succinylbenzoic acid--CoA ligase
MQIKYINNFFSFWDRDDLAAILKRDSSISYNELFQKSKTIAGFLSKHKIHKDNYVPLLIDDQIKFIELVVALWYLGAIPVPLNTKLLDDEIISILDDHDFKFLVTDSRNNFGVSFESLSLSGKENKIRVSHKDTKSPSFTKIVLPESNSYLFDAADYPIPDINKEAVVIFTSGSTGRPKGVVHTFSSLINSIENGNNILNHTDSDRWLASLPFYHIGGFQIICRSFYYGCSIILPQSLQINDLTKSITDFNPTHISLVSTQLERLIHQKVKPDESLRVSLIGGGFVNDELMIEADKLGWKPFRVYGSSETASMVTAISANEIISKPQSVGKPFKDAKIIISNESEILIQSNSLFKKYLDDEKETASKLIDGFYHSGDLGFVDADGYSFIEARRNDLIVTGGENVNPIEIEKAFLQFPFIKDACVFPKQNKTWGQIVACALVVTDSSIDIKSIKEKLKLILTGYKIPKEFYFVDELPRTSLGKLEREKIKKMF